MTNLIETLNDIITEAEADGVAYWAMQTIRAVMAFDAAIKGHHMPSLSKAKRYASMVAELATDGTVLEMAVVMASEMDAYAMAADDAHRARHGFKRNNWSYRAA